MDKNKLNAEDIDKVVGGEQWHTIAKGAMKEDADGNFKCMNTACKGTLKKGLLIDDYQLYVCNKCCLKYKKYTKAIDSWQLGF